MSFSLNRNRPEPLHYQVAEKLRSDILSGKLSFGQKLPSEEKLMETLHVSRPTIRQAITTLRLEGLVKVERGVGTFVTYRSKGAKEILTKEKKVRTLHHEVPKIKRTAYEVDVEALINELYEALISLEPGSQDCQLFVRLLKCIKDHIVQNYIGAKNE